MGQLYRLDFPNGKSYIGITCKDALSRFAGHKRLASAAKRRFLLYKAWSKHGEPKLVVLATMENHLLFQAEIDAIKEFKTFHPDGYNNTTGGEVSPMLFPDIVAKLRRPKAKGRKHTEDSKKKMSIAMIGNKRTLGQKRDDEFKSKMSTILKARWARSRAAT